MSTRKEVDYMHQVTVCESRVTGKYSLRNQGHLFWTGLEDDRWVNESVGGTDSDNIWETTDKRLVYAIEPLLEYSLMKSVPLQLLIDEL